MFVFKHYLSSSTERSSHNSYWFYGFNTLYVSCFWYQEQLQVMLAPRITAAEFLSEVWIQSLCLWHKEFLLCLWLKNIQLTKAIANKASTKVGEKQIDSVPLRSTSTDYGLTGKYWLKQNWELRGGRCAEENPFLPSGAKSTDFSFLNNEKLLEVRHHMAVAMCPL